ncbi:MAG: aldehyde ferredoxin oxidoreductase family protein [Candidatus Hadarchaeaceae archaeon]
MIPPCYRGKILEVDLSSGNVVKHSLEPNVARRLVGGKGLAAWLLYKMVEPGTDPFDEKNVLIFATGPLTGTIAPSQRGLACAKSPLTGTFSDSYFGGHFIQELKYAGYDALVVKGKSENLSYLWIDEGQVKIEDATSLKGQDTTQTNVSIKRELGDSRVKVACIGPAGEKKAKFALIDCDVKRQAGRGGLGAVMGSKNLKAVAIRGTGSVEVAKPQEFFELAKESYRILIESEAVKAVWSRYGTAGSVEFSNMQGFFPTKNFQDGHIENGDKLSGLSQSKLLWLRRAACYSCPIICSAISVVRKGPYSGTVLDGIEYETTGLLGANCGLTDPEVVAYANYLCDELGLDTITTGGVIGLAMELFERGIWNSPELGALKLRFGNGGAVLKLIRMIAHREGVGDLLAEGVKRVAEKIGGRAKDFVIHIKGLETPAWPPRGSPGMGLALATADRGGCHERGWPVGYEVEGFPGPSGPVERLSLEGKAELVKWEQDWLAAVDTLIGCDFSRNGLTPEHSAQLLSAATGWEIKTDEFLRIGERVWNLTRMFNVREGFTRKDDDLPRRFKEEPLPSGPAKGHMVSASDLNRMLDDYYRLRKWDSDGVPTREKLAELGLEEFL